MELVIYHMKEFKFRYPVENWVTSKKSLKKGDRLVTEINGEEKIGTYDGDDPVGWFDDNELVVHFDGEFYPEVVDLYNRIVFILRPVPLKITDNNCDHNRKYRNRISATMQFWVCPDCKTDLGDA